ncbi:MAG: SDR family oxidoreductase [Candidatus Hydrogenedentes bacterium]|nr:SDR family oxidoreductase [Candidatus Hydrogenedentota bacterium]
MNYQKNLFDLTGKVAVVTGGAGILGTAMVKGLANAGASVAIADMMTDKAEELKKQVENSGGKALAVFMDVFKKETIQTCAEKVVGTWGKVDILVNAVGGNMRQVTTSPELSFFDIKPEDFQRIIDLNLLGGAIIPSQIFGKIMVSNPDGGSIINIASMNAFRPLTRIPGYSAAKSAVVNFTQWLAVHFAQEYNPKLRVNAIAPGFFLTEQNRYLLIDEQSGELTQRGKTIIAHTPMGRFGEPDEIIGALIWLASDASKFVTGIVIPIDGGFSAYSGV